MNIALTLEPCVREVVAHRADCPDARRAAAEGRPVMTMFECSEPLPPEIKRHSCLNDDAQPVSG